MHIYIFSAYLQGTSNSYQQNASITACSIKKVGTFQLQRGPVNVNFIFVRLNCFFSLTKASISTNEQIHSITPSLPPPQSLPFSPVFFRETRPPDHRIPTHPHPPIPLSILYWPGAKLPFCLRSPGPWRSIDESWSWSWAAGFLFPQKWWRFNDSRLVILAI